LRQFLDKLPREKIQTPGLDVSRTGDGSAARRISTAIAVTMLLRVTFPDARSMANRIQVVTLLLFRVIAL